MALPPEADLPPQLWVLVFPGKSSGSQKKEALWYTRIYSNFWTKPTWLFSGTCPSRSRVLDCQGAGHTCAKVTNTCHESWHVLPCWPLPIFWHVLWWSQNKMAKQYILNDSEGISMNIYQWINMLMCACKKMRWMGFPSPVSAWCSACWSWMTCALYSLPILSTVGKVASLDSFVTYRGRTGLTGISRIFHL